MKRNATSKTAPDYSEESILIDKGYSLIAGLDEVGRGTLAGPVVAGVVILPVNPEYPWVKDIRDSKMLTPKRRERILKDMEKDCLAIQTGSASAAEIDQDGIVKATSLAMERALKSLPLEPQYLLLDAFPLPEINIPQKAIVKGDVHCLSIAAASIAAKVFRDKIMVEKDKTYPGYGFASNKGYGTKEHLDQLSKEGPCDIHRYSFAPIKLNRN